GGAQSGSSGNRAGASSSQRIDVLRTLRGGLPGEDSAALDHALLARERVRSPYGAESDGVRIVFLGFRGAASGGLPVGRAVAFVVSQDAWPGRRGAFASADARLVRGARLSRARWADVSGHVAVPMSAREDILRSIRSRKPAALPGPRCTRVSWKTMPWSGSSPARARPTRRFTC